MTNKSVAKIITILGVLLICFSCLVPIALSEEISSDAPGMSSLEETSDVLGGGSESSEYVESVESTVSSQIIESATSDVSSSAAVVESSVSSERVDSSKQQASSAASSSVKPSVSSSSSSKTSSKKNNSSKTNKKPSGNANNTTVSSYTQGYQTNTSYIDYNSTVSFTDGPLTEKYEVGTSAVSSTNSGEKKDVGVNIYDTIVKWVIPLSIAIAVICIGVLVYVNVYYHNKSKKDNNKKKNSEIDFSDEDKQSLDDFFNF